LKCEIFADEINHEELTEFLNTNNIVDLEIRDLSEKLILNDGFYKNLRFLTIDNDRFINLNKFISL
jgi:hypothetical protein